MKPRNFRIIGQLSLLLFVIILSTGCEKDKIYKTDVKNASGLILFYGEPAVDGCGWIIKINDNEYSPLALDDSFKKDSLEVIVDFNYLDSYWPCGWREPGYQEIEVIGVRIND